MVIFIAAIILLAIVFVPFFLFGGVLIKFLGLKYNSFLSLIKFFIAFFLILLPVDLVIESFSKVLKDIKNFNNKTYKTLYFLLSTVSNILIIGIIDIFMKDIDCPPLTALVFSIIFFFVNDFIDKKLETQVDEEDNGNLNE